MQVPQVPVVPRDEELRVDIEDPRVAHVPVVDVRQRDDARDDVPVEVREVPAVIQPVIVSA